MMNATSRRGYLAGTASMLGGLLAAACELWDRPVPSRSRVSPQPEQPARRKVSLTLTVLVRQDWHSNHKAILQDLSTQFTQQQPHLHIEWEGRHWQPPRDWSRKFLADLAAGGRLGSVVRAEAAAAAPLAVAGAILSLNHFVIRDRYDLADYWPGAVEALRWQQDLYGLQTEVAPILLRYNQALLDQVGLTAPTSAWTWARLLNAAQRLTSRQPVYSTFGFALEVQPPVQGRATEEVLPLLILPWIWGNGGRMVRADFGESQVDRPEAQAAVQWLADLALAHKVSPSAEDLKPAGVHGPLDLFGEAQQLAMLYGSWHRRPSGQSAQRRFAVAEPPRGPQRSATYLLGREGLFVARDAADVDGAWAFLNWWTSRDTQRQYLTSDTGKVRSSVPTRRALAREFPDRYGASALAALEYAQAVPLHPAWIELMRAFGEGLMPIWEGKQSAADATASVAKRQNTILAEWRQRCGGVPQRALACARAGG